MATLRKFQVHILHIKGDIDVQKIKVTKSNFNSYYL